MIRLCAARSILVLALLWICSNTRRINAYSSTLLFPYRLSRTGVARAVSSGEHDDETRMASSSSSSSSSLSAAGAHFDALLFNRYACTRFERYDGTTTTTEKPSPSNPNVVQQALTCLDLARRAPSGFNVQPYKLVLVNTPEQKKKLARYCIGHNAHRVRDSDCTAVFLADREAVRTMSAYKSFVLSHNSGKWKQRPWGLFKIQAVICLFSSGYPLPRVLAVPISFGVRFAMSCLSVITFRRLLLPSLAGAETWSTKNTMLVAMAYMLGCTSRGLTTCPMEGFNAGGVRKALNIPRRYSIPIIVSTGHAYVRPKDAAATDPDSSDDMGMTHGSPANGSSNSTPRYQSNDIVYQDMFGKPATSLVQ